MANMRTLFEAVLHAGSEAEAQLRFDAANNAMPDNSAGHSVPVYYLNGQTGDMMVRYPDGREEKTGQTYPELIEHPGEWNEHSKT